MSSKYHGLGVAVITPFNEDLSINFKALEDIVEFQISNGVDFLVALGSTGEAGLLSQSEKKQVLETIIQSVNKRVPIVTGNFSGMNTSQVINDILNTDIPGIDAYMIAAPPYVKPSQEGLFQHYKTIIDASDKDVILYNVPGRTACNISAETTVRLANYSKKCIGIKEASGNLNQVNRILQNKPSNFFVLSGDDDLCIPLIACGGHGLISVIGNAFPMETRQMVHHALNGNLQIANSIQKELYPLYDLIHLEGNPTGIKDALSHLGFCSNTLRRPLVSLSPKSSEKLQHAILKFQKSIA